MTEITGNKRDRLKRHMIDPLAFCAALILGPIAVTGLTFWLLLVPVFALVLGGPVFVLTAVPVMMWWLSRRAPKVGEIAVLAFVSNVIVCALIWLVEWSENPGQAGEISMFYLAFGSVFAPLWGASFALFYIRMRRPFFMQTV